jgi:hypothetical protein
MAADLRDEISISQQKDYWHNRALHHAFGIVWPPRPVRPLENHKFVVEPFIAYDGFGKPLIHNDPIEMLPLDLPKFSGSLFLLAGDEQSNRSAYRIDLSWGAARFQDIGRRIPIARFNYDKGAARLDPSFLAPRCRRLTRPRVTAGRIRPADLQWLPSRDTSDFIFHAEIDTSAAGFVNPPIYIAGLLPNTAAEHDFEPYEISGAGVVRSARQCLTFQIQISHESDAGQTPSTVSGIARSRTETTKRITAWLHRELLGIYWLGLEPHTDLFDLLETNRDHT